MCGGLCQLYFLLTHLETPAFNENLPKSNEEIILLQKTRTFKNISKYVFTIISNLNNQIFEVNW